MKKIILLLALVMLIASCQAITVSMSTDGSSVSESFVMSPNSKMGSVATLSEGRIYHETSIKGDAEVSQSTSGGGQTFQASVTAPDIKTTQIATEGGVSGSVSYDGIQLLTSSDEEFLAANPELAIDINHLSMSGKIVKISGGAYPAGGVDLTEPWYIDPGASFKWTTFAQDYVPCSDDMQLGLYMDWRKVRSAITYDNAAWNGAAGKLIFDGTILTNSYNNKAGDGINAVYPTGSFVIGNNLMQSRKVYNTATRKVIDVDIAINTKYNTALWGNQAYLNTVLAHEMGESLGLKHNPYSKTSVMRPVFDYSQGELSGDDKGIAWAKYHN